MNINFKNKTVLITDGEGGIKKTISNQFLSLGAKVINKTTKKKIKKNNKMKKVYMYLDFHKKKSIKDFFVDLKKIKKINILINNSGINKVGSINEIEEAYINKIYDVNLVGPTLMSKEVSKIMIKNKRGKIINISSIFGVVGKKSRVLYTSTKFGLIGLTKSSALDLAKYNILVNSVSPGVIKTGLTKKILKNHELKKIKKDIPLNRLGNASEVAHLVCFLCSNLNNYITGQNFLIDGGYTSK